MVGYLVDNHVKDDRFYLMTVYTGLRRGAGTRSNVSFILMGDKGNSRVRMLTDGERVSEGFVAIIIVVVIIVVVIIIGTIFIIIIIFLFFLKSSSSLVARSRYSCMVVELTEFGQDIFCLLLWVH